MIRSKEMPAPLAHRQVLIVFSGLMLAMLLAALDSTIVAMSNRTDAGVVARRRRERVLPRVRPGQ